MERGYLEIAYYEGLLHAFSTGQERRNKPESSAAKLYCLHLQEPESKRAREQKKRTRTRKQEREKKQEQESESKKRNKNKKARTRKQEKEWQNPVPFKENYPPPRTYYYLIGCSPSAQLSSRERQNTWRENCPCTCADYVYYLEHRCQCHLVMANVLAASHKKWAL
jgi:hypothetical protein